MATGSAASRSSPLATAAAAPMPFWKTLVAGAVAGSSEVAVMYPTDVVKTRLQLSSGRAGMVEVARSIMGENPMLFYRGIASPLFAEAPKRATKFAGNEFYKGLLADEEGEVSGLRASLAGGLAGGTEAFVNCPFETVKVRLQSPEGLSLYNSTLHALRRIVADEGVAALYKGLEPQFIRNFAWNGTYFGVIGTVRAAMPEPETRGDALLQKFASGVIGGFLGTLANTPFDVAKSRMQGEIVAPGQQPRYKWSVPSLAIIAREEGVSALYKGLGPRLVRLGPGGGIMILVFDLVSQLL